MHCPAEKADIAELGAPSGADGAERHHALDLIRGLAALSVAQYHFMSWNGVATVESMGTFAVYVFFVLSGLTMMMVYGGRFADGLSPTAVESFFRKRAARLLPLLIAVAALAFIKQAAIGQADITTAVLTGTGLMALQMPGFLSNSVGAWSLGIEIAFYAVFPIIAMLVRSWKVVAWTVIVLLVAQHLVLCKIKDTPAFWDYYISNLTFAPFFGLGILIFFDGGVRKIAMFPIAVLGMAALLGFSLAVPADLMKDQASYLFLTLVCGLVIWAAWRSAAPAWLVPIGAFLGDISYSLYLTHWIVNDVARALRLPPGINWIFFTVATLTGSYICYRFFETPLRRRFAAPRASAKASTLP